MEQRSKYAAAKGVQIMLKREEYALGMEQSSSDAAVKDAQIRHELEEECALGMEQRS